MNKVVLMKGHDEKIDKFMAEMVEIRNHAKDQMKFLEKKAKQIADESVQKKKQLWIDVEERLAELKLIPEGYTSDEHMFEWDPGNGILWAKDSPKSDFGSLLADLLMKR